MNLGARENWLAPGARPTPLWASQRLPISWASSRGLPSPGRVGGPRAPSWVFGCDGCSGSSLKGTVRVLWGWDFSLLLCIAP